MLAMVPPGEPPTLISAPSRRPKRCRAAAISWPGAAGIGVIRDDPVGCPGRVALAEPGHRRGGRGFVGRADEHAGALGDQRLRGREAEAAAAAGHQVGPVPQSKIHADIVPDLELPPAGTLRVEPCPRAEQTDARDLSH